MIECACNLLYFIIIQPADTSDLVIVNESMVVLSAYNLQDCITLEAVDDAIAEDLETFYVIGSPRYALDVVTSHGLVEIVDNDGKLRLRSRVCSTYSISAYFCFGFDVNGERERERELVFFPQIVCRCGSSSSL